MATLESLLSELARLDAEHNHVELRRVREQIIAEYPDSEEAVEALYKAGLDLLFHERDFERAVERFAEAAKHKHPFWSAAARTSLGLCFYHQGRNQKALFELRRVGYPETPSVHSVTALAFIEQIFQNEGRLDEVMRVRKDRISQLEKLTSTSGGGGAGSEQRGYHLYVLGLAYRDAGEVDKSRKTLEQAKALGPDKLGADLYRTVLDAL